MVWGQYFPDDDRFGARDQAALTYNFPFRVQPGTLIENGPFTPAQGNDPPTLTLVPRLPDLSADLISNAALRAGDIEREKAELRAAFMDVGSIIEKTEDQAVVREDIDSIDRGSMRGNVGTRSSIKSPDNGAQDKKQVEQRLQAIFTQYKGSGNFAVVAQALLDFNDWYRDGTGEDWYSFAGTEGKTYTNGVTVTTRSLPEFMLTRQLACYEFVDFCVYIASDQPTRQGMRSLAPGEKPPPGVTPVMDNGQLLIPSENPYVPWAFSPSIRYHETTPKSLPFNPSPMPGIMVNPPQTLSKDNVFYNTDSSSEIPHGVIVTGVCQIPLIPNNSAGYFHTGISVGGGEVISMGSNGLSKQNISGVNGAFWGGIYGPVLIYGPYDYNPQNPAPAGPPAPPPPPEVPQPPAPPPPPPSH